MYPEGTVSYISVLIEKQTKKKNKTLTIHAPVTKMYVVSTYKKFLFWALVLNICVNNIDF